MGIAAQLIYKSYPHSDLLSVDPPGDEESIESFVERIKENGGCGDTLFEFLCKEANEDIDVSEYVSRLYVAMRGLKKVCSSAEDLQTQIDDAKRVSTHKCEVVRVGEVLEHDNADNLEIVKVFGYTVVVRKGDFKSGDLAVYIPPDSVVPETSQFDFLFFGSKERLCDIATSLGLRCREEEGTRTIQFYKELHSLKKRVGKLELQLKKKEMKKNA